MILIDDITDAWKSDILINIAGAKSCEVYEGSMNIEMMRAMMPRMPFVFLHYDSGTALEDQREANGASGLTRHIIGAVIGTASLRSRDERYRGAHVLIDAMRQQYNGYNLTVGDETITLGFVRRQFVFQENDMVLYYVTFQYFDQDQSDN